MLKISTQFQALNIKARLAVAMFTAVLTSACGGGGGGTAPAPTPTPTPPPPPVLVVPTAGNLQVTVPAPTYASDAWELSMFDQLNQWRERAGAGKLAQSSQIDAAALGHARWIALNDLSHTQTPGSAGFTGATVTDRFVAAGFASATKASESIGGRNLLLPSPPASCIPVAGPYHTADLFSNWTHVGISSIETAKVPGSIRSVGEVVCVMNLARTDALRNGQVPASGSLVTFPFDGGIARYQGFPGSELPRPPRSVLPNDVAGPSVVVGLFNADYVNWKADGTLNPTITQLEIKDDLGNVLPVGILSHPTLKAGPGVVLNADTVMPEGMVALVPLSPLTINKVYRVNFSATLKTGAPALTKSWTFTATATGL